MAVSPINLARVSHNMRVNFVLDSLRQTQHDLLLSQSRIASGRRFLTPSEDPIAATRALDLSQALARQEQLVTNVRHGDNFLAAADSALTEVNDLLIQASVVASQNVSNLTSREEREAEAEVVAAIRRQIQMVGNRQFDGRYIFAGRHTLDRPFIDALGGVAYAGDRGHLFTRVDQELQEAINMPGSVVFDALSGAIATDVDLTPTLTESTRLDDLRGATGNGIEIGTLIFNETAGAGVFAVDLADADTIGDVVTLINDAAGRAGSTLTASPGDRGLSLLPGSSPITITDRSAGQVASSWGITTSQPVATAITGADLQPRLAMLTPVGDLAGGAGIDILSGLRITNGDQSATIDLRAAETVQDIINAINNAGVQVLASINDAGDGIDVFNRVSGASLHISENGGTTATDLGIRTLDLATPLEQLNLGNGVTIVEGQADFRITATNGSTVDVNLDGARTVGDVIALINEAAAADAAGVNAELASTGNGIVLTDATGGTGSLSVTSLNVSPAAKDLGLLQAAVGGSTQLLGGDVNPRRTEGIIDALMALEQALRADDTQGISAAGTRLDELTENVTRIHGVIGARSQAMNAKRRQIEDAAYMAQTLLSEVQDLDYAEAVTQLQGALTQLQANLQTSSNLLNLSLLDFLR